MSVVMAFSTERVLLSWVEDLEQGLEELSRGPRQRHRNEQLEDLLQSARGLLASSQSELRKLAVPHTPLLDDEARGIRSPDDIRQLCDGIRRALRARSGDAPID
jgi:hypothetical protein